MASEPKKWFDFGPRCKTAVAFLKNPLLPGLTSTSHYCCQFFNTGSSEKWISEGIREQIGSPQGYSIVSRTKREKDFSHPICQGIQEQKF